jgi:hypothetical protein
MSKLPTVSLSAFVDAAVLAQRLGTSASGATDIGLFVGRRMA